MRKVRDALFFLDFQASTARPSDKFSMKIMTLEW
jgi:hypothetical protein